MKMESRTLYITHGHRHSVKSNLMELSYKSKGSGCGYCLFWSFPSIGSRNGNGTLFINPGSIRLPRGRKRRTYVILDILESAYQLKVYDMDRGEIKELAQLFSISN